MEKLAIIRSSIPRGLRKAVRDITGITALQHRTAELEERVVELVDRAVELVERVDVQERVAVQERAAFAERITQLEDNVYGYYCCKMIFQGMTFWPKGLTACCAFHHDRLGRPYLAEFNGGPIPVEEVTKARERMISLFKSGTIYPSCEGCPELEKRNWDDYQRSFVRYINFSHFTKCNLKCEYCYIQAHGPAIKTRRYDENNREIEDFVTYYKDGLEPPNLVPTLEHLMENNMLDPSAEVYWGGGEPTILRDFDQLTKLLSECCVFYYVNTNALFFSEALYDALSKKRVYMICTLDAATPETFAEIKGIDVFEKVVGNLKRYAEAGGTLGIRMIVMDKNCGEALEFVDVADKIIGAKMIHCDVNGNSTHIGDNIIDAIARVRLECQKRGLVFHFIGPGKICVRDPDLDERVERRLQQLL